MSATPATLCRSYALHGVNLRVFAEDAAVIAAMDLRLSSLPAPTDENDPWLSFEFVSRAPAPPLPGSGRPVYETPHGTLHYYPQHGLLAGELGGVVLHCTPGEGRAVIAAPEFRARTLYFATHPVATVALMEMMERHERFSLHAGCLATPEGAGLLLSGPSGAGKSTLTLALALAGMELLGDDLVFLEGSQPAPRGARTLRALGFADALGIGPSTARLFPQLTAFAEQRPDEGFPKRLLRSDELLHRAPASSCEPRVIVFPEVTAELPSAVTSMDRGEALLRLVPDVLMTDQRSTEAHVAAIAELLGQVSCYAVRSGHDLQCAAELVRELM